VWDVLVPFEQLRREIPCQCGGTAVHGWYSGRGPGLAGVAEPGTRGVKRTFQPGYDIQFGQHFETRKEQEAFAKARGLVPVGPEEFERNRKNAKEPDPDFSGLTDAMKDAWDEVKAGKHPPPPPVTVGDDSNIIGDLINGDRRD